ncbi:MAG: hypothetical protein MI700_01690, partial [Balneolales bacterium]|nr:hypothetical protein [Balneolales bacterium]
YGDRMGYDPIEKALGDRNYTVFSGHHHHYRYKVQNGMEHFTLATSGGGSWMRTPDVGELDHITWVTMKEDGPDVAHIDINGIYAKDFVPEEDYADIQVLRHGNWLEVHPVVHRSEFFDELPITLEVKNDAGRPLTISGNLEEQNGVRFEPSTVEVQLESGSSKHLQILARSTEGEASISDLNNNPIQVELTAGFERDQRNDITLSASKRLFLDWEHTLRDVKQEVTIDGDLAEWEEARWIEVRNPQYFQEGWDWKGATDGRFEFATQRDNANLYIAVRFFDQFLISDPENLSSRQDKFFLHIETEPATVHFDQFEVALSGETMAPLTSSNNITAAILEQDANQILELKIPQEILEGGEIGESIRINIGIMDHDRPENTKPSVLWWRPVWGSISGYDKSGTFFRGID